MGTRSRTRLDHTSPSPPQSRGRFSASRVLLSVKMMRFLLVHALLESTFNLRAEATCNEAEWPDAGIVCGECKVLVNNFNSNYYTCSGYCAAIGRKCTGAWEESHDTCTVDFDMTCGTPLHHSSDAICECMEESCDPNPSKCDSSIGGDCCTARYTSHEDRRCRDGWIPIYTGVGCGWPVRDGEANMFTCYAPSCSALPADNCGPNRCYDDGHIQKIIIIVASVISAVAIIGIPLGVYGCYRGKCCCFQYRQQPKPPQPMAQPAAAQPVMIPIVQSAI